MGKLDAKVTAAKQSKHMIKLPMLLSVWFLMIPTLAKQAGNLIIYLPGEMDENLLKRYLKGQMALSVNITKVMVMDNKGRVINYDRKSLGLKQDG